MRLSLPYLCVFVLALTIVSSATAGTIVVDQSGAGDAATIAGGIALASLGDVVVVRPGVYDEEHVIATPVGDRIVQVELPNGVSLVSAEGPEVTVIGLSLTQYGVWVQPGTDRRTRLEGFTVTRSLAGIGTYHASATVKGNVLVDNGNEGILINAGDPLVIRNTVVGAEDYGIRAVGFAAPTITRNLVAFCDGVGIRCESSDESIVECNDSFGNGIDFDGCPLGANNISLDPQFCGPDDYRLSSESPCTVANAPEACGRIGALDVGCAVVGLAEANVPGPGVWLSARPNPAKNVVHFELVGGPLTSLRVFDAAGRFVRDFDVAASGTTRTVTWDRRTESGERVAPGVYYYAVAPPGWAMTRRIVIIQ